MIKIKTIAVSNLPNYEGLLRLKASLLKYNIDHEIIITKWEGFYTKINEAYKFCKNTDYDLILFVDAHDVIFTGSIDGLYKLNYSRRDCVFSSEKACWPDSNLADTYPTKELSTPWKYLNSGSYLFKTKRFVDVYEANPPSLDCDDQRYFTSLYLEGKMDCTLDTSCRVFQSVAFESEGDFTITDKLKNNITGSYPLVLHGNGRTDMEKFYHL
jgi:hypothetical protein